MNVQASNADVPSDPAWQTSMAEMSAWQRGGGGSVATRSGGKRRMGSVVEVGEERPLRGGGRRSKVQSKLINLLIS
jgi:hypothetical protein